MTETFAQLWVESILASYGPANQGGVRMWSLDNEPELWNSTHLEVQGSNPISSDDHASGTERVDDRGAVRRF